MKNKYLYILISNIIILGLLPYLGTLIGGESGQWVNVTLLVFVNSVFFFIQTKIYSTKNLKAYDLMGINILCILLYMMVFFGKIETMYVLYYLAMMCLGIRSGGIARKIAIYKKEIAEGKMKNID